MLVLVFLVVLVVLVVSVGSFCSSDTSGNSSSSGIYCRFFNSDSFVLVHLVAFFLLL